MKVYIVEKVVDDEYLCTGVVFVTASEEKAKSYVEEHNEEVDYWGVGTYNTFSYDEVELQDFDEEN